MLGVENEIVHDSAAGWTPVSVKDNLTLMSIAFLLGLSFFFFNIVGRKS